jgi:hypothetical protein
MCVSEAIFIKLELFQQPIVKNPFTEFHENPADNLVADTMSQNDRRTDVAPTQGVLFFLCKVLLKTYCF